MNYSKAACTVIPDRYLLNYEWADAGSPCVALVFSPLVHPRLDSSRAYHVEDD